MQKSFCNVGILLITNASRGTVNARRFQSQWATVVMVVVFEFSVMRCQPLRRALYASNQKVDSSDNLISESA
ncbi:hypothetical protein VCSRO102_2942 [Vibrio cholerae]|nr:hypothetical protein VCSRO102_2942 [Vibrio cholerae]